MILSEGGVEVGDVDAKALKLLIAVGKEVSSVLYYAGGV